LREIDAITGSYVDAKLTNTASKPLEVTKIAPAARSSLRPIASLALKSLKLDSQAAKLSVCSTRNIKWSPNRILMDTPIQGLKRPTLSFLS